MNELGLTLIGGVARATALAALGVLACLALRRRRPSAGATAALTTLLGLVAVTALAPSPWPRWWSLEPSWPAAAPPVPATAAAPAQAVAPPSGRPTAPAATPPGSPGGESWAAWAAAFADEFRSRRQERAVAGGGWRWPAWVVVAYLAGVAAGLAWLGLGLRAVSLVRRRSRPIDDPALLDQVEGLRDELGLARPVALRESEELATPATVGWLRPALLLPEDWRAWDDRERRAVLAHELAHVRRGDYAAGLLAQLSLAFHFYHPLAHWLAGRLRLQQELAADSWGALLSGGRRSYLSTLARLALRRDEVPVSGPARAFLPTRGMFSRRIEMLRDAKMPQDPSPRRRHALIVGALVASGLLLAGLRGPGGPSSARALAAPAGPAAAEGGFDLSYVPAGAGVLVAGRPAELLGRPEAAHLANFAQDGSLLKSLGFPIDQLDQVTLAITRRGEAARRPGTGFPPFDVIILRATKAQDWKGLTAKLPETEEARHEGQTYRRPKDPTAPSYFLPDDRTFVLAPEETLKSIIAVGKKPTRHVWGPAWDRVEKGQLAIAVDMGWVLDALRGPRSRPDIFEKTGAFSPLLDKAYAYAAGVDASKGLAVDAVASCTSDEGAKRVAETAEAGLTLLKNALQTSLRPAPGARHGVPPALVDAAESLLAKARVERDGRTVRLRATADVDTAALLGNVLLPAVGSARAAARRAQSVNNLKQIALAMHNYQAQHGHFPPAAAMGPDGKTPHSWRIELLPFLDQDALYKQYKMDEPWDSPANRKVLEQVPAVYRCPDAGGDPTAACYFALTGPDTLMPADGAGVKIQEIADGLSNTLMFVEAKRAIPWTKPADIPYDPSKPLPELGGFFPNGFDAAFGDGSVKFLSHTINEQTLRALITKAGGEVVSF
jgi:hypothetical protein